MAYAQDTVADPNHFKSLGSSKTRHRGLFGAIEQDLLVLNDYEPATQDFPTEYPDGRFSLIENEFDFSQPKVAAWSDALDTAQEVAYVVSWGVPSGKSNCGVWVHAPLEENLKRTYLMEFHHRQTSRVQIWRRRRSALSASELQLGSTAYKPANPVPLRIFCMGDLPHAMTGTSI
jgi:hypothetical protein